MYQSTSFRHVDLRFLSNVALWAIAMAFHQAASAVVADWGHATIYKMPPLPDVGHLVLPNLQAYRWMPEILIHVPLIYAGLVSLYRWDVNGVEHFLQSHAVSMLLRALCFSLTLLPDASQMCEESKWSGSCHDLVFSGHMVALSLASMYLWTRASFTVRVLLVLNVIAAGILTVAVRNHYSVDVIVGLFVAPSVSVMIQQWKALKVD